MNRDLSMMGFYLYASGIGRQAQVLAMILAIYNRTPNGQRATNGFLDRVSVKMASERMRSELLQR